MPDNPGPASSIPNPPGRRSSGPSRLATVLLVGTIVLAVLVMTGNSLQRLLPVPALNPITATPNPTLVAQGPKGWVLLVADSFDNNHARWSQNGHDANAVGSSDTSIAQGVYTWKLHADNGLFLESVLGQVNPVTDVYMSAEVRLSDGNALDAAYGIVFGFTDTDNNLLYEIHANPGGGGASRVLQRTSGKWTSLKRWANTNAIKPGQTNRIVLQGDGRHFDFYANDQKVTQVNLANTVSGRVGLAAELSPPSTDETVQFDNVTVYSPSAQATIQAKALTGADFRSIALVGMILGALLVISRGYKLAQLEYQLATREQRRGEFASHLAIPIPLAGQGFASRLEALGFRQVGETQIKLPHLPQPGTEWIFFNADSTIYAELVVTMPANRPAIQFNTRYLDDAIVETSHPIGENINDPDYRTHRVEASLEAALEYHRQQVADFSMQHGSPKVIQSIDDMLIFSPTYRKKYMARRTRRTLLRLHILPFAGECVALLGFATAFLLASAQTSVTVMIAIFALSIGLRYLLTSVIPEILKRAT